MTATQDPQAQGRVEPERRQADEGLPRTRDAATDRRRRTVLVRILLAGAALTLVGTVLVAIGGGDGRAGMQWTLALGSATLMFAGVFGAIGGLIDQVRRWPISVRRIGMIVASFAGALLGVAMLAALQVSA